MYFVVGLAGSDVVGWVLPKVLVARSPWNALEERQIRKLAGARHAPADWIRRAQMITASWDGKSTAVIAQELGCHPQTVRERLHRFNTHGLEGLGDRPGSGRKPRLTETERSRIVSLVATTPPGRLTRRSDGALEAEQDGSPSCWTLDSLTEALRAEGAPATRTDSAAPPSPRRSSTCPPPRGSTNPNRRTSKPKRHNTPDGLIHLEKFRYAEQVLYEAILALMDPKPENLQTEVDRIRMDNLPSWVGALSAVWLHGSPEVVSAAMFLDQAQTDLFYGVATGAFDATQDWDQARRLAHEAFQRFIEAARTELGLAPVHDQFFSEPRLILSRRAGPPRTARHSAIADVRKSRGRGCGAGVYPKTTAPHAIRYPTASVPARILKRRVAQPSSAKVSACRWITSNRTL
ncbi:helix-turn-helix domain-containing protein [Nocardia sp. NPDC046763]|uniref:helix-turn-helix domain-containing protein n=1 Tax=Nocardia sp. NPDC046763 TaxID=3155256 RepID=UPI0033CF5DBF